MNTVTGNPYPVTAEALITVPPFSAEMLGEAAFLFGDSMTEPAATYTADSNGTFTTVRPGAGDELRNALKRFRREYGDAAMEKLLQVQMVELAEADPGWRQVVTAAMERVDDNA